MKKIRVVIVDDEPAAIDVIKELSAQLTTEVQIVGVAMNGVEALKSIIQHKPDLVFLDVDLPLMNGMEVVEKLTEKNFRIIFTTGSSEHALKAIKLNAVDYLLKPIDPAEFLVAMEKVRNGLSLKNSNRISKTRLLVKKGIENVSMLVQNIVLFYTENRIVYVLDKAGKKFLVDQTMNDLEAELDQSLFFRANRQYIVNLNFIKSFKPYEKVKLQLELAIPELNHFIIISQKSAPDFREWIMKL